MPLYRQVSTDYAFLSRLNFINFSALSLQKIIAPTLIAHFSLIALAINKKIDKSQGAIVAALVKINTIKWFSSWLDFTQIISFLLTNEIILILFSKVKLSTYRAKQGTRREEFDFWKSPTFGSKSVLGCS